MFAPYLAEYRVVPGRLGCSWVVFINQSLAIWEWISKCGHTTRAMIIKTARVDRIPKVNGRGSTLLSGLRLQLPQLLIFRFISRIRPSSIDETQCNEPRQQLFHDAFNDVPLIDALFGNELRQSLLLLVGCPKAPT